ncbi:hypothetical protein M422DRAFT_239089 [Sphaerobolus stellatus SS14]|nr:hypothetical protein M422DRAFT_239089 [Sphaerobolus stellatus SS14]
MKFLFALLCSALVVTATAPFTIRQEMPQCKLAGCAVALTAAAQAITACADTVNEYDNQNDPNSCTFFQATMSMIQSNLANHDGDAVSSIASRAAANVDCLVKAVDSAIDIDCTPCVQALFPMGTVP